MPDTVTISLETARAARTALDFSQQVFRDLWPGRAELALQELAREIKLVEHPEDTHACALNQDMDGTCFVCGSVWGTLGDNGGLGVGGGA